MDSHIFWKKNIPYPSIWIFKPSATMTSKQPTLCSTIVFGKKYWEPYLPQIFGLKWFHIFCQERALVVCLCVCLFVDLSFVFLFFYLCYGWFVYFCLWFVCCLDNSNLNSSFFGVNYVCWFVVLDPFCVCLNVCLFLCLFVCLCVYPSDFVCGPVYLQVCVENLNICFVVQTLWTFEHSK